MGIYSELFHNMMNLGVSENWECPNLWPLDGENEGVRNIETKLFWMDGNHQEGKKVEPNLKILVATQDGAPVR